MASTHFYKGMYKCIVFFINTLQLSMSFYSDAAHITGDVLFVLSIECHIIWSTNDRSVKTTSGGEILYQ